MQEIGAPVPAIQEENLRFDEVMQSRARALYRFVTPGVLDDKTVLSFDKIDEALGDACRMFVPPDAVVEVQATRARMKGMIEAWKGRDPATFHTVEGLFELRRDLYRIWKSYPENTEQYESASDVFRNVSEAIFEIVPPLCRHMLGGITQATEQLGEIEAALERNPDANVDAALRELKHTLWTSIDVRFKDDAARLGRYLDAAHAMRLREYLVARAIKDITSWKTALLDHFLGPKDGPWRRPKAFRT